MKLWQIDLFSFIFFHECRQPDVIVALTLRVPGHKAFAYVRKELVGDPSTACFRKRSAAAATSVSSTKICILLAFSEQYIYIAIKTEIIMFYICNFLHLPD